MRAGQQRALCVELLCVGALGKSLPGSLEVAPRNPHTTSSHMRISLESIAYEATLSCYARPCKCPFLLVILWVQSPSRIVTGDSQWKVQYVAIWAIWRGVAWLCWLYTYQTCAWAVIWYQACCSRCRFKWHIIKTLTAAFNYRTGRSSGNTFQRRFNQDSFW